MKIERIRAYTAPLRYAGEAYVFSHGRRYTEFPTTVVAVDTDSGLTGYGEVCPCGPAYMPAYAEGIVPALAQLAPQLLGLDPRETTVVRRRMDLALDGHAVAKTPLDLACWDLLGKAAGLPVYALLGGRQSARIPLHRVVPLAAPEAMAAEVAGLRAQGFRSLQIKLGEWVEADAARLRALHAERGPDEIFVGDANGAWTRDEAIRLSGAVREIDCILEQPCADIGACRSVRRRIGHPVKLDESLEDVGAVVRALAADAMDAAAIKLSRYGGLTDVRDLCAAAGIRSTVEEAWGSGIAAAAEAHLAASTDPRALLNATDIHNYNRTQIAHGAPEAADGAMTVSERPGLGTEPNFGALGPSVLEVAA
jgi:L-alanine-DL-glutamate epimerase-like enolase superfamily enzyme